jgi:hypothetical protein
MSFYDCESLIKRYAPLMMRVGDRPEETERPVAGVWRPPVHPRTIARMKQMRQQGRPIGDIARKCGLSWRTAWKHT